jgi:hypothetical protein
MEKGILARCTFVEAALLSDSTIVFFECYSVCFFYPPACLLCLQVQVELIKSKIQPQKSRIKIS